MPTWKVSTLFSHAEQEQTPNFGAVGEPCLSKEWSKTLVTEVVIKACYTLYELLILFSCNVC